MWIIACVLLLLFNTSFFRMMDEFYSSWLLKRSSIVNLSENSVAIKSSVLFVKAHTHSCKWLTSALQCASSVVDHLNMQHGASGWRVRTEDTNNILAFCNFLFVRFPVLDTAGSRQPHWLQCLTYIFVLVTIYYKIALTEILLLQSV